MLNNYREKGRAMSVTEGSEHYHTESVEPIDLMIAEGLFTEFALGNVIKYAARASRTGNTKDLVKLIDYATILLGYWASVEE